MKFEDLFNVISEAKFKKSKHIIPLATFPMFSLFLSKDIAADPNDEKFLEIKKSLPELKKTFNLARKQIHKLGFKSMHANVILKYLSKELERTIKL